LIGPNGAGNAAKLAAKADDVADAVGVIKNGSKATDAMGTIKTVDKAENAATTANTGNKVENAASTGSTSNRVIDEPPASCPLRSFTAETLVLMADGTHQSIESVQVGDQVMAYDPGTGTQSVETVTATWPHQDTVVTLTLSDGVSVETTASHPWWVESRRAYVRTDHLDPGDHVLTVDGSTLTVEGMSGPQGDQQVYNLTVTGPHTYYVTDTSILVHNCGNATILQNQANGNAASSSIAAAIPGAQEQVYKNTSEGARIIDVLTPAGEAIESKLGRTSLTTNISEQVAKDVALLHDPTSEVASVTWQFTVSPVTGKGGPTAPLRALLESEGISIK